MSVSKPAQDPKILEISDVPAEGCKWVKLRKIKWQDQEGKERFWECADRSTRKGEIDAVDILALIHHPNKPVSTVIEEQYRPPIGNMVVELPAGLVDEGESAEDAALRELYEETGYGGGNKGKGGGTAEVLEVTPILVSDPGLTSANMRLVTVKIQLTESDPEPQANLDEGEHIVKRIVPLKELYGVLKGAFRSYGTGEDGLLIEVCAERIDYDKKGYTVDARLAHFALGWRMGFESKDD